MIHSIVCKRLLVFLTIAVTGFLSPVFAVDLLEMPAVQSSAATRTLLLDLENRGERSFVAVGTYGVIIVSDDNGESWVQSEVPASVALTGVSFPSPESGWAVGHDGLILHSADGGKTWQKQLDGVQLNQAGVSAGRIWKPAAESSCSVCSASCFSIAAQPASAMPRPKIAPRRHLVSRIIIAVLPARLA
jgi:photosystem II stability/assembly factor-like uncharacterized protein